ncbi:hypothetical protein AVEN_12265-1 [Araneus ventricosus]|uniref:Uncharacterized protein n=1 Tax=Araneus ventricosus TaxID=182803 RepID=A0A4Y2Q0J1_ARAVE|nr:hypothetical protein AVEN_12265-1 [Araneus ventricosus]
MHRNLTAESLDIRMVRVSSRIYLSRVTSTAAVFRDTGKKYRLLPIQEYNLQFPGTSSSYLETGMHRNLTAVSLRWTYVWLRASSRIYMRYRRQVTQLCLGYREKVQVNIKIQEYNLQFPGNEFTGDETGMHVGSAAESLLDKRMVRVSSRIYLRYQRPVTVKV